ncbi:MAG: helix-turn-helix domain-containing protein [Bacteroidales bacterium]|nr:helix-turn-helix domain-containing protein [Bacteroidales bacterium]
MNSIPDNRINDFVEDSQGYIWFGTGKGLFRYNGSIYKTFYSGGEGTLTSDFVMSLCSDTDSRVWVGTDGGINLIHDGRVERSSKIGQEYVFHIINYSDSTLLYSGQNAFYLYDKATGKSKEVIKDPDLDHGTNFIKADEYLWILSTAYPNLVIVYDSSFSPVRKISLRETERVSSICHFGDMVYMSSNHGLKCFSTDGLESSLPSSLNNWSKENVLFVKEDPHKGIMLIGISGKGIYSYSGEDSPSQHIFEQETLSSPAAFYKVCTTHNALWLIPWMQSPKVYYEKAPDRSYVIPGMGVGEILNALYHTRGEGKVWAVTTGGVYLFDPFNGQSEKTLIAPENGNSIFQYSCMDRKGDLHILDNEGNLYNVEINENGQATLKSKVKTKAHGSFIWYDYENNMCAIQGKVLYVIDENGSVRESPQEIPISGIPQQGQDGRIYFVGAEGIFYLDSGHRFAKIGVDIPMPSCCFLSSEGDLYIGSVQNGLYRYHPSDGSLKNFTLEDGLPDMTVRSITEDLNNDIWLSTRYYTVKLSSKDERISVYDYAGDLPLIYSPRCALTVNDEWRGEKVVLGGNQFISVADPFLGEQTKHIHLSLDAVFVNNTLIDFPKEGLRLKHDENQILFYYSGLEFAKDVQLNYSYKLEGYEDEWVIAGQNLSASYSRLKAGNYVFRVKVYSSDGSPSPEEIAFPLHISRAPWLSVPAILSYCLAAILVLFLLVRQYFIIKKGKEEAKKREMDKIMAEKQMQDKMEVFNTISHDFLTPLSLVYGPARDLEKDTGVKGKSRQLLELIVMNADRMMKLTDRLMNFSRIDDPEDESHIEEMDLSRIAMLDDTFRNLVEDNDDGLSRRDKDFLEKMEKIIQENIADEDFNPTVLADRLGISYTNFYYKVKNLLNTTPQDYLISYRLNRAMELLKTNQYNVSEVSYMVGFGSLAGFSRSFKHKFGVPPSSI